MWLQCHMNMMKEKIMIIYLKVGFVTLVGVNNSDRFMVKTRTGFPKSPLFTTQIWVILWHQSLGCLFFY